MAENGGDLHPSRSARSWNGRAWVHHPSYAITTSHSPQFPSSARLTQSAKVSHSRLFNRVARSAISRAAATWNGDDIRDGSAAGIACWNNPAFSSAARKGSCGARRTIERPTGRDPAGGAGPPALCGEADVAALMPPRLKAGLFATLMKPKTALPEPTFTCDARPGALNIPARWDNSASNVLYIS